eukprot:TRINITY_DN2163_c0_g1_i1.p1 TRINITY_DN2163_c0_g1~~TRINITY_DN2163_c0_g1_i1.p1  ORF type:complete len:338 (+),score=54.00 TRINITY_DN2163_c0_g1_i1:232-1245(+)
MPLLSYLNPPLSPKMIASLNSASVRTVEDLICSDLGFVSFRSGVEYDVLKDIISGLQATFSCRPIHGRDLLEKTLEKSAIFPLGHEGLDTLLDGGLYTGEITEIIGQSSIGKTQLCLLSTLAVTNGTTHTVAYIDSSNTFSPERIIEMYQAQNTLTQVDENLVDVLERIRCWKCYEGFDLGNIIDEISRGLQSEDKFYKNLKLIVVDSIGALLSPLIGGKQSQGHAIMAGISRSLKYLACTQYIAVLVTNYMVSSGWNNNQLDNDANNNNTKNLKAALGESWTFITNTSLIISEVSKSKNKNNSDSGSQRIATLIKSSHGIPSITKVPFVITEEGIK